MHNVNAPRTHPRFLLQCCDRDAVVRTLGAISRIDIARDSREPEGPVATNAAALGSRLFVLHLLRDCKRSRAHAATLPQRSCRACLPQRAHWTLPSEAPRVHARTPNSPYLRCQFLISVGVALDPSLGMDGVIDDFLLPRGGRRAYVRVSHMRLREEGRSASSPATPVQRCRRAAMAAGDSNLWLEAVHTAPLGMPPCGVHSALRSAHAADHDRRSRNW